MKLRTVVEPVLEPARRRINALRFPGSGEYWERRYHSGGNSGAGSYGRLAGYKATFINEFVDEHGIQTVVEFGSGDGSQLELAEYPEYLGVDLSPVVTSQCVERFRADSTKQFLCCDLSATSIGLAAFRSDLALSLDVVYHLVEDSVFVAYMQQLFAAAGKFVIVYASNWDARETAHVRHRQFSNWVRENAPDWILLSSPTHDFPYDPEDPDNTSWASFYVFGRRPSEE